MPTLKRLLSYPAARYHAGQSQRRQTSLTGTPADSLSGDAYITAPSPEKRAQSRRVAAAGVQWATYGDAALAGDTRGDLAKRPLVRRGGIDGRQIVGYSSPLPPPTDNLYWNPDTDASEE